MVAPLVSLLGRFDDGNDRVENIGLVSLDDVSTHDHLVDYKVRLLYVKHYLQDGRTEAAHRHTPHARLAYL